MYGESRQDAYSRCMYGNRYLIALAWSVSPAGSFLRSLLVAEHVRYLIAL